MSPAATTATATTKGDITMTRHLHGQRSSSSMTYQEQSLDFRVEFSLSSWLSGNHTDATSESPNTCSRWLNAQTELICTRCATAGTRSYSNASSWNICTA